MAGFGVALLSALAKAPGAYQESRGREIDLSDRESDAFGRAAGANALAILSKGPLGMPGGGMPGMGAPGPGGAPGGAPAMPPGMGSQAPSPPVPPPQLGPGPPPGIVNPARIGGQPQNLTGPTIMPPSGGPPNGPPAAPPGLPQPPQQAGGMPPRGMMPVPQMPPQMPPQVSQQSQMVQQPRQLGQQQQQQQSRFGNGPLDWRQAIQAIQQANPGISPQHMAGAMKFMLPYMTLDARQEWLMAHNQFLEEQLRTRDATQRRAQDVGLERTRESIEAKLGSRMLSPGSEENHDALVGKIGRYEEAPPSENSRLPGAQALMADVFKKFPDYDRKEWYRKQNEARSEGRVTGQRGGALDLIIRSAEAAIPAVLEQSKNVYRSGFVPLNKLIQAGQVATSDPALKEFAIANLQLAEHWARAMNPTGVMRNEDRNLALAALSTADSKETYERAVRQIEKQIKRERASITSGADRQKIYEESRAELGGDASGSALPEGWSVKVH